ncbi:MAG: transcription-repair coupling factor [Anaerolineaceae bacterium]|nr:transcription-repair coupling factor [Anaerolineaceae bacterium]
MAKPVNALLLGPLQSLPAYQDLEKEVEAAGFTRAARHGLGLPRSARLAVLAALHHALNLPIVLLTNRADRALALFDELNFWLPDSNNQYFPEPNSLFYEDLPWSMSTKLERLAVLASLGRSWLPGETTSPQAPIIVSPIRAVMTRTIPRRDFLKNTQRIALGDQRNMDETARHWVGLGYEYSNIVVQPGQFSRRGGILDVWPPSEELPLRLEFFGDEIDTLRQFNPATQRTEAKLEKANIYPAAEALPLYAERLNPMPEAVTENDVAALYDYPSSLMDFLPANAIIMLDGQEFIEAAVNDIEEESSGRFSQLVQQGKLNQNAALPYLTWSEIEDGFGKRQVLELGHTHAIEGAALSAAFDPGPRFAGRLKDFQTYLLNLDHKEEPWLVVSRQATRLRQLWEEIHPHLDEETQKRFIEGSISAGWILHGEGKIQQHLLSDSEIFGWNRPQPRRRPMLNSESPEALLGDLRPGDWVVHVDHGIGQFTGLHKPTLDGIQREFLAIQYKNNDTLYVPIHQADRVSRYVGPEGITPEVSRLGGNEWDQTKVKVRHAVVEVAGDLLELYAKRQTAKGYTYSPDSDWQKELEASFPYIETADQLKAIQAVKADMESNQPMDRLLCGDVGYGKTEVALRAAFKAVADGKQVAILVPTTILAQQHFDTFRQRLAAFPVTVDMLSRFRNQKEQTEIIRQLAKKNIDIIIGTHRLISSDVQFKDLGLVIIDEEQRFGVMHKEHLKRLRAEVDVLTLTATPIPRTLYMALSGVRDISTINSPPEERLPIITQVGPYDAKLVREAVIREMDRGGQVFFVHNRVHSIPAVYNHLQALIPEARIGIGHGQMDEAALADVMHAFTEGQLDILLSTSIIESGLDIPNANTLIVDRADTFGLSQLYQLRGRVGRGAQRAFAYLFYDKRRAPTIEGEERLEVLTDNSQLGAGYAIAMRDLEMRGAGDLLGTRQSGYIEAVGFQLYTRLLSNAVRELRKATGQPLIEEYEKLPFMDMPSLAINVDLPLSSEIPSSYIPDQGLRLTLYRRISTLRSETDVTAAEIEFSDRFGELPQGVKDLLYQMRVKILGEEAGLENIGFINTQLVLNYPPLPNGVRERHLAEIDAFSRAGKNSYWLSADKLEKEDWQSYLLRFLRKLNGIG